MGQFHSRLATGVFGVLVLSGIAQSQEVIDQQNDPVTTISFHCGSPPILNASILQSFVPTKSSLSAVELRLRAGSAFPSTDVTTTIRIRAGSPTGTVLAASSAVVSANQVNLTQMVVRFEFGNLALTPGGTYLIEWDTPANTTLSWMGAGDMDHYPAGTAYSCKGTVWNGDITDFNFTTFSLVESTPCQRIDSLADRVDEMSVGRSAARLQRLLAAACDSAGKQRPNLAMLRVELFRHQVRILVHIGRIAPSAGKQLMDDAREISLELRNAIPRKQFIRKWWKRRRRK